MWTMLRVAASGMQAQQTALDTAAHNMANVQTPGFKVRRAAIVDLPPSDETLAVRDASGATATETRSIGQGVTVGAVLGSFTPGALLPTGRPLDVAITGDGFFQVTLPDGRLAYTRDGALQLDGEGRLLTANGLPLSPPITLPAGAQRVVIASDGRVVVEDSNGGRQEVGQLTLARFVNPEGLESLGESLFVATPASGEPIVGVPGQDGLGSLAAGSLEASNVDVSEEMVRVLQAQRAYQVNLRALQTVDEMLQQANNLRR